MLPYYINTNIYIKNMTIYIYIYYINENLMRITIKNNGNYKINKA